MATALERPRRSEPGVFAEAKSGNAVLIETLRRWGVRFFAGVNGGGVVHVAKHLEPYYELAHSADQASRMLTMGEYVAGFMPLGYWLASGRIAGCVTTTGAATKLGGSGMTDAKLHNIPAVYLIALNSTLSIGNAPLQDVSEYGMNVVPQLQAELGEGLIVVDNMNKLEEGLRRAQRVLKHNRPVAIAFHPDVLSRETDTDVPWTSHPRTFAARDVAEFLAEFPRVSAGKRVVIYVSGETAFAPHARTLTTLLSKVLKAPTVWSVNGANAVDPSNEYGFGHISFGGNERAMELWRSLGKDDVVIALGFDAGEYSLNLAKITAGHVYHFTDMREAYGHKNGEFRHRVAHEYRQVRGDIGLVLEEVLPRLATTCTDRPDTAPAPESLNTREPAKNKRPGTVDFQEFYERVDKMWRPGSFGVDDVCIAYKDRQWATQRPNPNIPFWTTHDGSAMGGGFGIGLGAKAANPDLHTFVFTGDGCFRLFGGALADAANMDLRVFIVNNEVYGIVDKGLEVIIPDFDKKNYHSKLPHIDFVKAAEAHGWDAVRIAPDLSNLKDTMDAAYERKGRSMLIDLPVDADQILGLNPRLNNLTTKTYL